MTDFQLCHKLGLTVLHSMPRIPSKTAWLTMPILHVAVGFSWQRRKSVNPVLSSFHVTKKHCVLASNQSHII